MARLLAMYKTPADKSAFDAYYFSKHVPLAKTIPGLTKYEVNSSPVMGLEGPAPIYLVATLHFASMATLGAGLGSPEGRATAADLGNFAGAGVDVFMFDDKVV